MDANELVGKYLGKKVIICREIGVVYAVLIRPEQYGPLLKVAFGKTGEAIPTVDDVYYEVFDHEWSYSPESVTDIFP